MLILNHSKHRFMWSLWLRIIHYNMKMIIFNKDTVYVVDCCTNKSFNIMITLYVITLSGFHCTWLNKKVWSEMLFIFLLSEDEKSLQESELKVFSFFLSELKVLVNQTFLLHLFVWLPKFMESIWSLSDILTEILTTEEAA